MSKNKPKASLKFAPFFASKKITFFFGVIFVLLLSALIAAALFFSERIYPSIYIAQVNLIGLTKNEAKQRIDTVLQQRKNRTLTFTYKKDLDEQKFEINLKDINFQINFDDPLNKAFSFGHKTFYYNPVYIDLEMVFDEILDKKIDEIAKITDSEPANSQLKIEDNTITVTPSNEGASLDKHSLKQTIISYLNSGSFENQALPVKTVNPKLSYDTALNIKKRLDEIKLSPFKLTFQDQSFTLGLDTLLSLIDLDNIKGSLLSIPGQKLNITSFDMGSTRYYDTQLLLNKERAEGYIKGLSEKIDRPSVEPLFSFDGVKVTQFKPPREGYKLDKDKTFQDIQKALQTQGQTEIKLPVEITKPKNHLVNDLGIQELLGRGVSYFRGSIPNRVHNITLTASKINGLLVPPGEVFSFNQTVGDISAETGFKQAYVIKSGRTVLDDGGGVCQDSSTLFRAVLNAGLPVVERVGHAYRVGYYEQGFPPGLDATVFAPTTDFKFKNDTNSHILIQAYVSGSTIYVDLYGSSDGRVTKVSKPSISNITPAPQDLHQEDPTLPKGTTKQVDWSAQGATVVFTRTVTKNGEVLIKETFKSNYRPWQAIYLIGTGE